MTLAAFAPTVVCRPALPSDTADVLEFTKFIWEGHDYIKYVWSDWLADPQGILAVAEYAGHAVGMGKLTCISPGQWRLEGLRVDPKFQGLKIASHIHEYLDDWWQHYAGGAVLLMTSWERVQVHHLSERMGYRKLGEVRSYTVQAGEGGEFHAVRADELGEAAQFAARHLVDTHGLMDSGWQFSEPDESALRLKQEQDRLWWWMPRQGGDVPLGLLACWDDQDDAERVMGIGFAAVERSSLRSMLQDVRGLAGRLGFTRLRWLAPALPWLEAVLKDIGFETEWDGTAFLFGKRKSGWSGASNGQSSPE